MERYSKDVVRKLIERERSKYEAQVNALSKELEELRLEKELKQDLKIQEDNTKSDIDLDEIEREIFFTEK